MSPMSILEMISNDETLPAAGVAHAHCGADDARPPDPPDPGPGVDDLSHGAVPLSTRAPTLGGC